jgi:tripartite-type tricarboxylate transporter receptor subunit TctC
MRKRRFLQAVAAAAAVPPAAWAEDAPYPSRPLKLVVNYPPGGASDLMARLFGKRFGDAIGQAVVVDNRPGAGGTVGSLYVIHQPADGYTFMWGNMGIAILQPLLQKLPFDVSRDFTPVSLIATAPLVLVANGNAPYRDLKGLVEAARDKPGGFNFGSGGAGTLAHLTGEMMNLATGLKMQHIPYKGSIQGINDVIAGQLDMIAADPQPVLAHIRSGKLRAIAVTTPKRFDQLPEVPTFVEAGMPDLVALNSWSILLPAGVPAAVQEKFRAALVATMTDPTLRARYAELGVEATHTSAQELRNFMASESARYGRLIRDKGIKAEG